MDRARNLPLTPTYLLAECEGSLNLGELEHNATVHHQLEPSRATHTIDRLHRRGLQALSE